jgi:hypothetical protein
MDRRVFLGIAGGTIVVAGVTYYLLSDKSNFVRADVPKQTKAITFLLPDERAILSLASLAPSGHNTQPWFVQYVQPYHWIIGNEKSRWLNGVDPTQRETMLSIGAFMQTLEYAANSLGYKCTFSLLATHNQDKNVVSVSLSKSGATAQYEVEKIRQRRTIRSNFLGDTLRQNDLADLTNGQTDFLHFIPNTAKEYNLLNEQTIEANRLQAHRDAAQAELADWIRFSSKDVAMHCDGLTLAGMEITGLPAWYLRNFYGKKDVMTKAFRQQSIDKVKQQVSTSAGWMLITSKSNTVNDLLETGMRMQRLFLNVRARNIALHPMTQILEETTAIPSLQQSIDINGPVQFILRMGYVKSYPAPVSLRRPVDRFVRAVAMG